MRLSASAIAGWAVAVLTVLEKRIDAGINGYPRYMLSGWCDCPPDSLQCCPQPSTLLGMRGSVLYLRKRRLCFFPHGFR